MSNSKLNGFANALMSKTKHLGEPRQASHKLNKRQHKANCGYKEVSAKPRAYGMAKDKTFGHNASGITQTPLFGAKTYKRYGQK